MSMQPVGPATLVVGLACLPLGARFSLHALAAAALLGAAAVSGTLVDLGLPFYILAGLASTGLVRSRAGTAAPVRPFPSPARAGAY